jgi:hypothetical protein
MRGICWPNPWYRWWGQLNPCPLRTPTALRHRYNPHVIAGDKVMQERVGTFVVCSILVPDIHVTWFPFWWVRFDIPVLFEILIVEVVGDTNLVLATQVDRIRFVIGGVVAFCVDVVGGGVSGVEKCIKGKPFTPTKGTIWVVGTNFLVGWVERFGKEATVV